MIKEEDVGRLFTTNGEDVWRLIAYCSAPTATMENLETKERVGGAIYSPNLEPFKRLVKDSGHDSTQFLQGVEAGYKPDKFEEVMKR